jgi:ribonuclease HI
VQGSQHIDKAEASAILAAHLLTDKLHPDIIYTDSQSTIDSIQSLKNNPRQPKAFKKMANYSIIKSIVDAMATKTNCPQILKVKAHTPNPTPFSPEWYNAQADMYAQEARVDHSHTSSLLT